MARKEVSRCRDVEFTRGTHERNLHPITRCLCVGGETAKERRNKKEKRRRGEEEKRKKKSTMLNRTSCHALGAMYTIP